MTSEQGKGETKAKWGKREKKEHGKKKRGKPRRKHGNEKRKERGRTGTK
jgi:hypothetical protein